MKIYESLSVNLVRQHWLLASEASMWPRITASNAVNDHCSQVSETCPAVDLCAHDNNRHGAHTGYFRVA